MIHPLHTACLACSPDPFRFVITTDLEGVSNDDQFTLPLNPNYNYNFTINWGDGNIERIINNVDITHTYGTVGTRYITITGIFPSIYFKHGGDCKKVIRVESIGNVGWRTFEYAFDGCTGCNTWPKHLSPTVEVVNMNSMFRDSDCQYLDVTKMKTSNVTDMGYMFSSTHFEGSVSNFDTSNVTDMGYMFEACYNFNQSVSNFDTSSVTNMWYMFTHCYDFNQSVSNFDTSNVTDMGYMFSSCNNFNQDISTFDISSLTDATDILTGATSFSTSNYDKLLIAWANKTHNNNVPFGCEAKYTAGGDAETARTALINDGWTITDGGPA